MIMGLKAKPPSLIQFYSITAKLDTTNIQMCTPNVTLNLTTSTIFLIYDKNCISPKSMELWSWGVHWPRKKPKSAGTKSPPRFPLPGSHLSTDSAHWCLTLIIKRVNLWEPNHDISRGGCLNIVYK